jgi:hypothetical protein
MRRGKGRDKSGENGKRERVKGGEIERGKVKGGKRGRSGKIRSQ